jgi:hypothetical protein
MSPKQPQKKPNLYLSQNTIMQQHMQNMRVESPKPTNNNSRKSKGEPGRYSFWTTKRSDQKTPTEPASGPVTTHDGNNIKTPKAKNSKQQLQ